MYIQHAVPSPEPPGQLPLIEAEVQQGEIGNNYNVCNNYVLLAYYTMDI